MKQYFEIKSKHPDAILLFRVGDFYETFSQDAIDAAEILGGITLTRRGNGVASFVDWQDSRIMHWIHIYRSLCGQGNGWLSATNWKILSRQKHW